MLRSIVQLERRPGAGWVVVSRTPHQAGRHEVEVAAEVWLGGEYGYLLALYPRERGGPTVRAGELEGRPGDRVASGWGMDLEPAEGLVLGALLLAGAVAEVATRASWWVRARLEGLRRGS